MNQNIINHNDGSIGPWPYVSQETKGLEIHCIWGTENNRPSTTTTTPEPECMIFYARHPSPKKNINNPSPKKNINNPSPKKNTNKCPHSYTCLVCDGGGYL